MGGLFGQMFIILILIVCHPILMSQISQMMLVWIIRARDAQNIRCFVEKNEKNPISVAILGLLW